MSRQTRLDWFSSRLGKQSARRRSGHARPLGIQSLEERRLLAVVTVDTLSDTIDFNDGLTSLREAVFATNTVPGADTIEFAESLTAGGPATILLTQGELAITDALAIAGPGATHLTIDASGSDQNLETFATGVRNFNIDDHADSAIEVSLSGLTLTGGDPNGNGGAILSREQLSIAGMKFVANHSRGGGAISHAGASATIVDSLFVDNSATGSGNGGALFVEGLQAGRSVLVTGNQFASNSASNGGAIAVRSGGVAATLLLEANTIFDNTAINTGGGLMIGDSTLLLATIRDSTITGNQARNGGGVFVAQTRELAVFNTIISNNISPGGARGGGGGGVYLQNSDVSITGSTITGNQSSSGGGIYQRAGELAINYSTIADNKALSSRGGGIVSEQGRFSLVGSVVSGNSSQSISNGGGGIWLAPALGALPVISDSRIEGNSSGGTGGGIDVRTGNEGPTSASLTLHNVTIAHNTANGAGGGINAVSTSGGTTGPGLALFGGAIIGNSSANGTGGGIHSALASLNIQGTTISENRARGSGGGIMLPTTVNIPIQVSIVDATFNGNVASSNSEGPLIGDGGALSISSPTSIVSITDSTFTNNSARSGGAIFRRPGALGSPFVVSGSTISGNTAFLHGGGIYNERGPLTINRSTIIGNHTANGPAQVGHGGGVFNRMADLSINASIVSGNSAASRGGGLYHTQGDLVVMSSTLAGNSALFEGGAIQALTNSPTDRILIQSSTVSGNSSTRTGGLYLRGDSTIRHSTIVGNSASAAGRAGGIIVGDGSSRFELDHSIVAGNSHVERGAPDIRFFISMNNVSLRSSLVGDNSGTTLVEASLGSPDANGNLIGKPLTAGGSGVIDPLVGALSDNGGPTPTHALLPGSPALDAGSLVTGAPLGYDQRGNPFSRMVDGTGDGVVRIDMGAYESQGVPSFSPGDFNRDGIVDACDYTYWRATFGSKTEPFAGADANGSGIVDQADYAIWKANFGQGLTFTTGHTTQRLVAAPTTESAPPATTSPVTPPPALPAASRPVHARRAVIRASAAPAPTDEVLAAWSSNHRRLQLRHRNLELAVVAKENGDTDTPAIATPLDQAFASLAAS